MAEQFNIPPWQVVNECDSKWWGYIREWDAIRSKALKERKDNG